MMTENFDWTGFKRQIFIKAHCSAVFNAWTTAGGIVDWFIAEAQYRTLDGRERAADEQIEAGDRYFWRWHQDLETSGEVLEVNPDECLRFTFGDRGDGEKVVVSVDFRDLGGETVLALRQENMPSAEIDKVRWYMGCNMGWSFFMTNLKARLEHGADLREYDAERAYASRAISL